jgi:Tfp pilus assembly protein PilF
MAISSQPNQFDVQRLIQLFSTGQYVEAESNAKKLISKHPEAFVLHHVLALALDAQQKYAESVTSYKNAIKLQPNMADLHFNLGIALGHLDSLDEAETSYRNAIKLNHNFFEAHGNLGTLLQRQGRLEDAIASYQTGLKINPQDARGYFNLGTALRDNGMLADAIKSYMKAIELFPNYTDAHNNLGETFRDQGNMDAAVKCYQMALALNPAHANANYNMAEFLYLAQRYDEAIPYFERSQLDDWEARSMYCLYKAEHFDEFKSRLDAVVKTTAHNAPFIATLSSHYATNFGVENPYNFCKNGFDFVYQNAIPELAEPNSPLLKQLLDDIKNTDIAERAQGMLYNGKQSAGNLFKRPETSFRTLGELVRREFMNYKNKFAGADCELIKSFPSTLEFTSSWYVRMRRGGYVDKHIHEVGWISGAVYLVLPTRENPTDGCFEYGLHGDNYPQKHDKFPVGIAIPSVGDIVLFPSSLFHRTIPFNSNEERICIAFDLKPTVNNGAKSNY